MLKAVAIRYVDVVLFHGAVAIVVMGSWLFPMKEPHSTIMLDIAIGVKETFGLLILI